MVGLSLSRHADASLAPCGAPRCERAWQRPRRGLLRTHCPQPGVFRCARRRVVVMLLSVVLVLLRRPDSCQFLAVVGS